MRIPKMERGSQYRVTVPALNGGVNLKDAPTLVEDNQLTAVKNMWWMDQALRTRPGLATDEGKVQAQDAGSQVVFSNEPLYLTGNPCTGMAVFTPGTDGLCVRIYLLDAAGECTPLGGDISLSENAPFYGDNKTNVLFIESDRKTKGCGLYLFFEVGSIYELSEDHTVWNALEESDLYAPLVMINGHVITPEGEGVPQAPSKTYAPNGTLYEGYNVLCGRYRCQYSDVGAAGYYAYPEPDYVYQAEYTLYYEDGTVTTYTGLPGRDVQIDAQTFIRRSHNVFYFCGSNGMVLGKSDIIRIEALFICHRPGERPEKDMSDRLFGMRQCCWFGGDRSGINGGTRLFLAGNPEVPNLVYWSDVNNPLYVSENNYAAIGNSGQCVTAFGKQSDMLVIFKEHELYFATYVAGGDFTSQDIIDGKVIDVAANMATFPITQLHAYIGCDCPQTIQLCNNRLVWADSSGKVYTLTGATPYSERNVRELSGLMEPALKAEGAQALKDATSGDFDGHYVLQVGNSLYLLDYNSSGFEHNTSYTGDNALRHMPWYVWKVESPGVTWKRFLSSDDKGTLLGEKSMNDTLYRIAFTLTGNTDAAVDYSTDGISVSTSPIPAMFQTKIFDFGYPDRRKNIRRLHIGATDTAEGYITLSYITENGVQEDAFKLGLYGTGELRSWAVTPGVSRARQFGLRAESEGNMAVDGVTLKYEVNGEVR